MKFQYWCKGLVGSLLVGGALVGSAAIPPREALRVDAFTVQDNRLPNNQALAVIKGELRVKNVSQSDVRGVRLVVHLRDGRGKDLDVEKTMVGVLHPGQVGTFDWRWRNASSFVVSPVAEVLYYKGNTSSLVTFLSRPTQGMPALKPKEAGAAPAYTQNATGPTLKTYATPSGDATAPGSGVNDNSSPPPAP